MDAGIATWIVLGGAWVRFVDDILCGITRVGDHVFDTGTSTGFYSVKLGSIFVASGSVTSFETKPEPFGILPQKVDMNGFASRAGL